MMAERIKYRTLLRGLLVVMSATRVVRSQTTNVTTTKCYNDTDSYVCFTAESSRDSRLRSWTAAKDHCQGGGFTLPTKLTPLIQFHLTDFLVDNDFTLDSVWIGGKGVSTGWTWVDGTAFKGSISNQSSPFSASVAAIEEIYDGNFTHGNLLEYSLEKEIIGYICQYKDGRTCFGDGTYYSTPSCFVRYDESINWFLARNKCLLRGGDLATLTDMTDAAIKTMLDNLKYPVPEDKMRGTWNQYWIGLRKIWWKWISDDSEIKISYFKYNPTLDNTSSADQNCLAIDYKQQFAWGIRDASVKLQTICQGGAWTDTPTTPTAAGATAAHTVSLPVWAVGLICGLCGLFYIISLIVVGIICCKCCGKQRKESHDNRRPSSNPVVSGNTEDEIVEDGENHEKGRGRRRREETNSDGYEIPKDPGKQNQIYANEIHVQPRKHIQQINKTRVIYEGISEKKSRI